jgi:hypothetical protein
MAEMASDGLTDELTREPHSPQNLVVDTRSAPQAEQRVTDGPTLGWIELSMASADDILSAALHESQNLAPGRLLAPHELHLNQSGRPQLSQYLAVSRFSVLHFVQRIASAHRDPHSV